MYPVHDTGVSSGTGYLTEPTQLVGLAALDLPCEGIESAPGQWNWTEPVPYRETMAVIFWRQIFLVSDWSLRTRVERYSSSDLVIL